MDFREIEAFLTLARTLHFGRAAEEMRLSQARVSQLIRALERRVGAPLFERTSRRVVLTGLGERLLGTAGPSFHALGRALEDARAHARGLSGELRVGHLPNLAGAPLTEIADAFRLAHPGCAVHLVQVTMDGLREAWDGGVDMLATFLPVEDPEVTVGPGLGSHDRVLAIAEDHPLAAAGRVTLEQLGDLAVPAMPGTIPPRLRESYWPRRTPAGRPIRRVRVEGTYRETLHLVARGELVVPVDTGTTRFRRYPGVTFVPIVDMPPARAVLTWRTARTGPLVEAFAAAASARRDEAPVPATPRPASPPL
ncbi:LysR family transcriptional regulator [Streptosporangium sp. NPDC023615]|uniref:LysR family transcriptional regulator n=1 Tax=Streptosporangium sp. NPDC023615 TaxID=3154794 RepID=UPI0034123251